MYILTDMSEESSNDFKMQSKLFNLINLVFTSK
jgi:hypothetical protein